MSWTTQMSLSIQPYIMYSDATWSSMYGPHNDCVMLRKGPVSCDCGVLYLDNRMFSKDMETGNIIFKWFFIFKQQGIYTMLAYRSKWNTKDYSFELNHAPAHDLWWFKCENIAIIRNFTMNRSFTLKKIKTRTFVLRFFIPNYYLFVIPVQLM